MMNNRISMRLIRRAAAVLLVLLSYGDVSTARQSKPAGRVLFQERFDTALTAAVFDTRYATIRMDGGYLRLLYSSIQPEYPGGLICHLPPLSTIPETRVIEMQMSGGGTEMSNSLFVAYAVRPGRGLCIPSLPAGNIPGDRSGYIVRWIRHGDGTNELKFYRSDDGWAKELRSEHLASNPLTTLRQMSIRHGDDGSHEIQAVFDTGVRFERTFLFTDSSYPPGNEGREIHFAAKGHASISVLLNIATDSWSVRDIPAAARKAESKTRKTKTAGSKESTRAAPINVREQMTRAWKLYDDLDRPAARSICQAVLAENPYLADALDLAGRIDLTDGERASANRRLRHATEIHRRTEGFSHPRVAENLILLARLNTEKDTEESLQLYRDALSIREKTMGMGHRDVALLVSEIGDFLSTQGRLTEAERQYRRVVSTFEKDPAAAPLDMATSLTRLGWLYVNHMNRDTEAQALYRKALGVYEKFLGADHPETVKCLHVLAVLYGQQERWADAEPLFKKELDIKERVLGPDHPEIAKIIQKLAEIYRKQKQFAKAEPYYQRELSIREKSLGPDHPEVAGSLNNLANLYLDMGRFKKSEDLYTRAAEIVEKQLGPVHPFLGMIYDNMAKLYQKMDRTFEASEYRKKSGIIRDRAPNRN